MESPPPTSAGPPRAAPESPGLAPAGGVDKIMSVLRLGRPRLGLLPGHRADKYALLWRRSCQSGSGSSNRSLDAGGRELPPWAPRSGRADVRGCLGPRYRLEGDAAGECQQLASSFRCGTRGWRALPGARESEMGEDPLNDGRVLDRGDELHPPGPAWTTQDVQVERAPHQRRPRPNSVASPRVLARLGPCRARIRCAADVRAAIGDDLRSPPRVRASTP